MEKPIARKIQRTPKDFLANIAKPVKSGNLYTFNNHSSVFDSGYRQNAELSEQNPEIDKIQQKQQKRNSQVYYDAEAEDLKQEDNLSSLKDSNFLRVRSGIEEGLKTKQLEIFNHQLSQPQQQIHVPHPGPQSGTIIKQKLTPSLSQTQAPTTPQRQFNRLALSLLGVKRTKYNKSCLQNKVSSNVQQMAQTRYNRLKQHQSYSDMKNSQVRVKGDIRYAEESDGMEVYQESMYPFPVRKIQGLKREINRISGESRLRRNYAYQQNVDQIEVHQKTQKKQQKPYGQLAYSTTPQLKITIKTSLSTLKNLIPHPQKTLHIILPQFFLKPPSEYRSTSSPNTQILTNQSIHIFTSLQIPISNINIRKYSNCIVIVNHNICIVWHEGKFGKKYVGGWKNKYFDQGEKEGMGMEWAPGRYVYYGQFRENKRNGFGVMRKNDQSLVVGFWKNGKSLHFGIEKNYIS